MGETQAEGGRKMRGHRVTWAVWAVLGPLSTALLAGTQGAAQAAAQTGSRSYAVTTMPAYYSYTKTVTFANTGNAPALNVRADVVLMAPKSAYAKVDLVGYSEEPNATFRDTNGNLIAVYDYSRIKPGRSVTIRLQYQATSSDVSYRLPKTYAPYNTASALYIKYTNPKLEAAQVNTGAPAIKALDANLVGHLTNPYQRAQVLFNWVAQNIRYNYSLKASGSALATLRSRLGICSDIADLYVSLLRTDHIPARLIGGYVTNNGAGQGGFHQWVQFYLPHTGWVAADPTWGRFGYFAALEDNWHIPLYDGIRSDISVHWQYAKSSSRSPYLAIHYHYHFTSEKNLSPERSAPLPIARVAPPVSKQPAVLNVVSEWGRILHFFGQYVTRLKIGLESL